MYHRFFVYMRTTMLVLVLRKSGNLSTGETITDSSICLNFRLPVFQKGHKRGTSNETSQQIYNYYIYFHHLF